MKAALDRAVPWMLVAALLAASVVWIARPARGRLSSRPEGGGDFAGYLIVGELALGGKDIYRDAPPNVNTWPPFFSLVCVGLALVARPTPIAARAAWLALNYGLFYWSVRMCSLLIYEREFRLWRREGMLCATSPEIWVPIVLCYRFILGNFDHLQVNIVIFALTLAGLYWQARSKDGWAGAAIGLAAAMKVMPIVILPYFVFRKRYRLAAVGTAVTLALTAAPAAVYGWARFERYFVEWLQALGVGWRVSRMNQSVFAMFDRYLGYGTPLVAAGELSPARSGTLAPVVATAIVLLVVVAVAIVTFRAPGGRDDLKTLAEYAVVLVVSALFGPVCWKAYLVVLLFACMVLYGARAQPAVAPAVRAWITAALALYFLVAALPAPGIVGKHAARLIEAASGPTIGALLLLAGLLGLRESLNVATAPGDQNR